MLAILSSFAIPKVAVGCGLSIEFPVTVFETNTILQGDYGEYGVAREHSGVEHHKSFQYNIWRANQQLVSSFFLGQPAQYVAGLACHP
jgi:hypothetical protein